MYKLFHGDCIEEMDKLIVQGVQFDSIVTDPPYEIGFMENTWDNRGISFRKETWERCFKLLKSGGHLLCFGGTRTFHRIACAIEDAGFEIRDTIMYVYGTGLPKSLDISKAFDKKAGTQGEQIGERRFGKTSTGQASGWHNNNVAATGKQAVFAPATEEAKQWYGWGTALKPAYEPILLARKPFKGTVIDNVATYGVGGINIDACRIPTTDDLAKNYDSVRKSDNEMGERVYKMGFRQNKDSVAVASSSCALGRFPSNFIHDGSDEVTSLFPDTGVSKGGKSGHTGAYSGGYVEEYYGDVGTGYFDSGSASRFFYCTKASREDKDEGCEALTPHSYRSDGTPIYNGHPTVKPTDLMQYLCKLITPPNGTILDPFMGSGSTGKAAILEGFNFVGIELEQEYVNISKERIKFVGGIEWNQ